MIMNGNPELGATRERRDASHERRQSVLWTKINVLGGPWVVASDETGSFCWNLRSLEQQNAASGVRGSRWWCTRWQSGSSRSGGRGGWQSGGGGGWRRRLAERRQRRLAER